MVLGMALVGVGALTGPLANEGLLLQVPLALQLQSSLQKPEICPESSKHLLPFVPRVLGTTASTW